MKKICLLVFCLMIGAIAWGQNYGRGGQSVNEFFASDYGPRTHVTVTNLIGYIGTRQATIVIDGGAWLVTKSFTVPSNIEIVFARGSYFNLQGTNLVYYLTTYSNIIHGASLIVDDLLVNRNFVVTTNQSFGFNNQGSNLCFVYGSSRTITWPAGRTIANESDLTNMWRGKAQPYTLENPPHYFPVMTPAYITTASGKWYLHTDYTWHKLKTLVTREWPVDDPNQEPLVINSGEVITISQGATRTSLLGLATAPYCFNGTYNHPDYSITNFSGLNALLPNLLDKRVGGVIQSNLTVMGKLTAYNMTTDQFMNVTADGNFIVGKTNEANIIMTEDGGLIMDESMPELLGIQFVDGSIQTEATTVIRFQINDTNQMTNAGFYISGSAVTPTWTNGIPNFEINGGASYNAGDTLPALNSENLTNIQPELLSVNGIFPSTDGRNLTNLVSIDSVARAMAQSNETNLGISSGMIVRTFGPTGEIKGEVHFEGPGSKQTNNIINIAAGGTGGGLGADALIGLSNWYGAFVWKTNAVASSTNAVHCLLGWEGTYRNDRNLWVTNAPDIKLDKVGWWWACAYYDNEGAAAGNLVLSFYVNAANPVNHTTPYLDYRSTASKCVGNLIFYNTSATNMGQFDIYQDSGGNKAWSGWGTVTYLGD